MIRISLFSVIFLLLPFFLTAQQTLSLEVDKAESSDQLVPFFNLDNSAFYQLNGKALFDFAQQNAHKPFSIALKIDDKRNWEIALERSKVHGQDFKIINEDGQEIPVETNMTYKGYLVQEPDTKVRMTIAKTGIHGLILDKNRTTFETINRTINRSANDLIAFYSGHHLIPSKDSCGVGGSLLNHEEELKQLLPPTTELPNNNTLNTGRFAATFCPKLAVTLDWQGLQKAGSLANFNSDLQTMLNIVNGYYDVFNVQFELAFVHVISTGPNPWTDAPGNQSQLTENYANWATPNLTPADYNCSLLFTGTDMNGIGYAYIGQMCPNDDFRHGEIDYQYAQPLSQKANLTAHELGHLWGANHGSTSDQYIMSPSIYDGNLQWTSTSTNTISNSVNTTFNSCLPSCSGSSILLARGPYLQSGTPTSTIIKWRTNSSTDSKVWYGTNPNNLNLTQSIAGSIIDHEIMIDGLTANTTYYYAIGDNAGQITTAGNDFYFKTAPTTSTAQPITAWILGDCGTANSNQSAVRDAYYNYIGDKHTDMMLLLGDNAYNSGLETEYQNAIFNMYPAKLKNTMMWSCPGNHDYYGADGLAAAYYDIFTFPTSAQAGGIASNTEKYYSFDYGNIHIVSLDSHDESRSTGSPMLMWLENDLAATSQEWIVVLFHHPPYSKGSHDSDTEGRMIEMRENVLPILESYGVDLVLSGHSHAYERSRLINGHYGNSGTYNPATHNVDGGDGQVDGTGAYQQNNSAEGSVYIVTGSAGKKSSLKGTHLAMHYVNNNLGSTILEVNGGQMDIKFLNANGTIEDYLTLLQNGTPAVNWANPANHHVFINLDPITLAATASDSDGSVTQVEFFINDISIGIDNTAPYSINWTPPSFAEYTLKVVATDNAAMSSTKTINVTVQDGIATDITIPITAESDDAEERLNDGDMGLNSGDLELGAESGSVPQAVGLRFNKVFVPKGATITNAYLQFTNDESESETTNVTIYGQASDNATTFTNTDFDITNRTKTSASVNWSPSAWTVVNEASTNQQSPNLKSIIQEIIDRPSWVENNSLAFIITGTGDRTAFSYDGTASKAPRLHLSFTLSENSPEAPTINWTSPTQGQLFNNLAVLNLKATATDDDGTVSQVEFFVDNVSVGVDTEAPYATDWTPTAFGNYTLKVVATDNDTNTNMEAITISINSQSNFMVTSTIGDSYDDAEERISDGDIDLTSTDLELGAESSTVPQEVGMRFDNIDVPQGAMITNAYIQFTTDEQETGTTAITFKGQAHDNAPAFAAIDFNISNRVNTAASVNWNPAAWTSIGEASTNQQSPNISTIIQEIVNRAGWEKNNALVITATGSGDRTAESYEGSPTAAPSLHIAYSLPNGQLPTANWVSPANGTILTKLDPILFSASAMDADGIIEKVEYFVNNISIGTITTLPFSMNWSPTAYKTYQLKIVATDNSGNTKSDEIAISISNTVAASIPIATSSDDAEERISDGNMNLSSSDLELVDEGGISKQAVGLRFNSVGIPQGATIKQAYIQFTTDESTTNTTNLTLYGQASDNAPTFTNTDYNISNRSKTNAAINWTPAAWANVGAATTTQQTPDLKTIIQEIVNRTGWTLNNALAIIITGAGERTADSYDGSAFDAPKLYLTFEYDGTCDGTNLQLNDHSMPSRIYRASETIASNGTINAEQSVTFMATQSITLNAGFHAQANSDFQAMIQVVSCNLSDLVPEITAVQRTNLPIEIAPTTLLDNLQLQVYPNPTNDFTTIRCYLPQPSAVQMQIINGQGQVVAQIATGTLDKGWHQTIFEAGDLASGVYFVRIGTGYGVLSERVLVVR